MALDDKMADSRLDGLSILLAEDNVTNQLVATQMLKSLGAEVEIASDGAIALELLKAGRRFDVLLIDIEMPRVSGLDVIRAVRASDWPVARAPVIALTAYAMQEHKVKILEAGADGLIPKPITSILQFGVDVRGYMNAVANRSGAADDGAAPPSGEIDMGVYESLVATMGPSAMPQLLKELHADLVSGRNQIETAADSEDLVLMGAASHMLVSVAGAIGGVRLQKQVENLNRLCHAGDAGAVVAGAPGALAELDGVIAFVAAKSSDAMA